MAADLQAGVIKGIWPAEGAVTLWKKEQLLLCSCSVNKAPTQLLDGVHRAA